MVWFQFICRSCSTAGRAPPAHRELHACSPLTRMRTRFCRLFCVINISAFQERATTDNRQSQKQHYTHGFGHRCKTFTANSRSTSAGLLSCFSPSSDVVSQNTAMAGVVVVFLGGLRCASGCIFWRFASASDLNCGDYGSGDTAPKAGS